MAFISVTSFGFVIRFIIAFGIIAYLYSRDKSDKAVKNGFVWLVALGALVLLGTIIVVVTGLAVGGVGILGDALARFRFNF